MGIRESTAIKRILEVWRKLGSGMANFILPECLSQEGLGKKKAGRRICPPCRARRLQPGQLSMYY
jgi:hypothetical protein